LALGSSSGNVPVLGFGASHAEVAEVLPIAPAIVDFRFGSTGIMYTVDRQDWEVDGAVVGVFAGHNINNT